MRGSLLDVLRLDYVTTARAKGLERANGHHQARAAKRAEPDDYAVRVHLGALVSGSFIAEIIFRGRASGRMTLDAILTQDQYLVMGAVLMASLVLIVGNLIADLLLAIADPRISYD